MKINAAAVMASLLLPIFAQTSVLALLPREFVLGSDRDFPRQDVDRGLEGPGREPLQRLSPEIANCLRLPGCGREALKLPSRPLLTDASFPIARIFQGRDSDFQKMWDGFPDADLDGIKLQVGHGWLDNACTVRVSYAMNKSGLEDLKIDSSRYQPKDFKFIRDLSGSKEGQGFQYIYRVDDLVKYLVHLYGRPSVVFQKTANVYSPELFNLIAEKKGIILYEVESWEDATGHFDLWNGTFPRHVSYALEASAVYLWE